MLQKCSSILQSAKNFLKAPKQSVDKSSTQGGTDSAVTESDTLSSAPGPSSIRRFFDLMDERSQKNADELFACAVYAAGSPLMLPSSVDWKRFLNIPRPPYINYIVTAPQPVFYKSTDTQAPTLLMS